jgi:aspartate aminotransferase
MSDEINNSDKHVSLNLNIRGLSQSATIGVNDQCKVLQKDGNKIYRLGLGQSPFPVPEPVVEALRFYAPQKDYLPAAGHPELRHAVAEFHRQRDKVEVSGQIVLIGPGSKELMFLLQLVYYGELIVPTPCWVSYTPQAKIIGRNVTLIKTFYEDKWRITADRLESIFEKQNDRFRPRILILNYPGNPEGCTYTTDELKEIAEVARKYQIVLLSDEIYGQLHHQGQHVSIARYYPEGTIISSGLSKWCGAGGWRLGTFTFPKELEWLFNAMTVAASETFTSVSAPIQCAAITAFKGSNEIEEYLWHTRKILNALGIRCHKMLSKIGVKVHPPEGGFYLFLDFSNFEGIFRKKDIWGSNEMCQELLKDTGVAILPGESFERPCEELTARLAYVDFDGARALQASKAEPFEKQLPDDFIDKWCSNVIEAVDKIVHWVAPV